MKPFHTCDKCGHELWLFDHPCDVCKSVARIMEKMQPAIQAVADAAAEAIKEMRDRRADCGIKLAQSVDLG